VFVLPARTIAMVHAARGDGSEITSGYCHRNVHSGGILSRFVSQIRIREREKEVDVSIGCDLALVKDLWSKEQRFLHLSPGQWPAHRYNTSWCALAAVISMSRK
jgi:hypothetical protein